MILKATDVAPSDMYKILTGCIVPRPIGWISTVNENGVANLAPFSFFNAVSADPPMVIFSPAHKVVDGKDGPVVVPKDTLRNVEANGEFVVNVVSFDVANQMNISSGEYDANISEFGIAGVTPAPSELVRPPRVAESRVSLECKLFQLIKLGDKPLSNVLVIGEIIALHLDDEVYVNGKIDIEKLDPVGRLAGNSYCTTRDRFELRRPK